MGSNMIIKSSQISAFHQNDTSKSCATSKYTLLILPEKPIPLIQQAIQQIQPPPQIQQSAATNGEQASEIFTNKHLLFSNYSIINL